MQQSKFKSWVNSESEKPFDQMRFSKLSVRAQLGIILLCLSYAVGYGVSFLTLLISGLKNHLTTGLLHGSIFYIISWPVGAIGLALAGKDCIKYPIYFFAKFLKITFPNYFTNVENHPVENDIEDTATSKFHLITFLSFSHLIVVLSVVLILLIVLFSTAFTIYSFLLIGVIIICCLHQTIYVYSMFSASSNFFFKTVKGKEYFDKNEGILFRFDDGPHPVYTPQILDILQAEGVTALFAVTGKNAEMYPEIVARMQRENHIIANHTYSHPCNILFLSYNRIRSEVARTNTIIQSITGERPKYFCPPIGHKNPIIGKVTKDLGLIPVMWDIRTLDTYASYEKIMATIMKKLKSPAIIMFHDAIIHSKKNDRVATVLALKETIRTLKEKQLI